MSSDANDNTTNDKNATFLPQCEENHPLIKKMLSKGEVTTVYGPLCRVCQWEIRSQRCEDDDDRRWYDCKYSNEDVCAKNDVDYCFYQICYYCYVNQSNVIDCFSNNKHVFNEYLINFNEYNKIA